MYRSAIALFAASLLLALASCREPTVRGRGTMKTEQRSLTGNFSYIESELPVDADIQVVPGSSASIELTGYENVLAHIKLKIDGDKLRITTDKDVRLYSDKNLKAKIIVSSLTGLDIVGSSLAVVKGTVTGKELELNVAGSGAIEIDSVNLEKIAGEIAGSGSITIKAGTATKGDYEIAGSGDLHAQELSHTDAEIEIAGSGLAELTAVQKLNIEIAGSGDVRYKGHPAITKDVAGSGDITDVN